MPENNCSLFEIEADASAQSLLRLLNYFAQQDLLPVSANSRVEQNRLIVTICQRSLPAQKARIIAEKMRSNPTVRSVLLSICGEKQQNGLFVCVCEQGQRAPNH